MDLNSALSPYPLTDYQGWADELTEQAAAFCPLLPYREWSKQNSEKALALFKLNTDISEALYPALLILENAFRNSINAHLKDTYGNTWFQLGEITFNDWEIGQIRLAKSRIKTDTGLVSIDDDLVIGKLNFGFWSTFFERMHSTESVPNLYTIFNADSEMSPDQLSMRIEEMVDLRNKVAHFQCIIDLELGKLYSKCCELIGWLSAESRKWCEDNCRFRSVYPGMDIIVGERINSNLILELS